MFSRIPHEEQPTPHEKIIASLFPYEEQPTPHDYFFFATQASIKLLMFFSATLIIRHLDLKKSPHEKKKF